MRIVLLGPPGSGKAKFCELIGAHLQIPVLTSTSVLQRAATEDSELGRLAGEAVNDNRVSDELLLALLRVQLAQTDLANGFVLVDFPRNAAQADVLDSILDSLGRPLDLVLYVDVDPDELMERLVGRITCEHCGAQYNLYINPPTVEGVCDVCGTRVSRRPDDYEETISNRLRIYEGQTAPLMQYYELHQKLHQVAGDSGVQVAWSAMREIIDATPRAVVASDARKPLDRAATIPEPATTAPNGDASVKLPPGQEPKVEPDGAPAASGAELARPSKAGAKPVPTGALKEQAAKTKAAKKRSAKPTAADNQMGETQVVKGKLGKKPAVKKKGPSKTKVANRTATAKPRAVNKGMAAQPSAAGKKGSAKKKAAIQLAAGKQSAIGKKTAVPHRAREEVAKKPPGLGKATKPQALTAKSNQDDTTKAAPAKAKRSAGPRTDKHQPTVKQTPVGKKSTSKKTQARPMPKKKSRSGKNS